MSYPKQQKMGPLDVLTIEGDPGGVGIVLFHGFGSDASDLLSLSTIFRGTPRPTWFFPNGPIEVSFGGGHTGRAWFPIDFDLLEHALYEKSGTFLDNAYSMELKTARLIVEEFIKDLPIPLSKLFLGGFSQGAMLATEITLHTYENPAGLILLSTTLVNKKNWEKAAHNHAGVKFFQSHGKDDTLLPFNRAQEVETLLIQGGLQGKLHSFSGGHEIPSSVLMELSAFLKTLCTPGH